MGQSVGGAMQDHLGRHNFPLPMLPAAHVYYSQERNLKKSFNIPILSCKINTDKNLQPTKGKYQVTQNLGAQNPIPTTNYSIQPLNANITCVCSK